jgi:tRNA nucleotidyltransferase/poly(A) polymerase
LGLPLSSDWDVLVLNVEAKTIATTVEAALQQQGYDVRLVVLDATWGIYRVVVLNATESAAPIYLDVAQALNNSLEDDLHRRDMSINALAYQLSTHHWEDRCHGLRHLQAQQLVVLSEQNLVDDPLRLLRVGRFMATLPGFTCDAQSERWMHAHACSIQQVAPERCHAELMKLLQGNAVLAGLTLLERTGVLAALIPTLASGAVAEEALNRVAYWHEQLRPQLPEALFSAEEVGVVLLACLWLPSCLHNCLHNESAQPVLYQTQTAFAEALQAGAYPKKRVAALTQLRMWHESEAKQQLAALLTQHVHEAPLVEQAGWMRYVYEHRSQFALQLVWLALLQPELTQVCFKACAWFYKQQPQLPSTPILNGHQLSQLLQRPAGVWMKPLLHELLIQQALGQITTEAEALTMLPLLVSTISAMNEG